MGFFSVCRLDRRPPFLPPKGGNAALFREALADSNPVIHEMYFECQRLMNEDAGYLTWSYGQNLSAHNKRLAHPSQVAGNWHLDGCKITERWWFA